MILTWMPIFFLAAATLVWVFLFARTVFFAKNTTVIHPCNAGNIPPTSFVSVLLPVRNEVDRVLTDSVRSLLAQDYETFEIVAVDDCSTDGSLRLLRELANENDLLHVVQGSPPPAGWIGKTWALEQAKRAARGSWILAADADVIYAPTAISSVWRAAVEGNYDALSLLPRLDLVNFWERAVMSVIAWLSLVRTPPTVASDPKSSQCFGMGNFIMMRREAHDAVGGYSRYRGEILDDCWTMRLLKDKGYALLVADGTELISSRMYRNFKEIAEGFSRNSFAALNHSVYAGLGIIALYLLLVPLPALSLMLSGFMRLFTAYSLTALDEPILILSLSSIVTMMSTIALFLRRIKGPVPYALLCWIGLTVAVVVFVRSTVVLLGGRSVSWKGRPILLNQRQLGQE